jgi:hypothetical protein
MWLSSGGLFPFKYPAFILSGLIHSRREPHTKSERIFTMNVRSRSITALVAIGMALPIWAMAAADSIHKTVHIGAAATVAGKQLPEGDYDLMVSGNQAKFASKGKVVAEVPCTWKTLSTKAEHDMVMIDSGAVTEIEFQGKTQAIDF